MASDTQDTDGPSLSRDLSIGHICEDGEKTDQEFTLPLQQVLTGRAFITGKSGSGKSNSASVIIEEILDRGLPLMMIDTEGEYWGLKEQYEILHVGGDDECDLRVGPEHADKLADLALKKGIPIIVDISGYLDEDVANELIREVAKSLFHKEKKEQLPFPLFVEEVHEYIPQQGSPGKVGQMLVQIGKRGRKRGLGIIGLSQRPADVEKSFITQCDWLFWHRLTWNTDTKTVGRILGSEYADQIEDHDDGQAFVMADFLEAKVTTVQVRRKRTHDAGKTPGLDDQDRPALKSVSDDIASELDEISKQENKRQDRIAELEDELEAREETITELEQKVERVREVGEAADEIAAAVQGRTGGKESTTTVETELVEVREQKEEKIAELEQEQSRLQDELAEARETIAEKEARIEELEGYEDAVENLEEIEEASRRLSDALGLTDEDVVAADRAQSRLSNKEATIAEKEDRIEELEARVEELRTQPSDSDSQAEATSDTLLTHQVVQEAIDTAKQSGKAADEHYDAVLGLLQNSHQELSAGDLEGLMSVSEATVRRVLEGLSDVGIVKRSGRQPVEYKLNRKGLTARVDAWDTQQTLNDAE